MEQKNKVRDTKLDSVRKEEQEMEEDEEKGALYLDKLIISHLQSAPTAPPHSIKPLVVKTEQTIAAGPSVDFPLSPSQRSSVPAIHQRRWTPPALTAIRQPLLNSAQARSRR